MAKKLNARGDMAVLVRKLAYIETALNIHRTQQPTLLAGWLTHENHASINSEYNLAFVYVLYDKAGKQYKIGQAKRKSMLDRIAEQAQDKRLDLLAVIIAAKKDTMVAETPNDTWKSVAGGHYVHADDAIFFSLQEPIFDGVNVRASPVKIRPRAASHYTSSTWFKLTNTSNRNGLLVQIERVCNTINPGQLYYIRATSSEFVDGCKGAKLQSQTLEERYEFSVLPNQLHNALEWPMAEHEHEDEDEDEEDKQLYLRLKKATQLKNLGDNI